MFPTLVKDFSTHVNHSFHCCHMRSLKGLFKQMSSCYKTDFNRPGIITKSVLVVAKTNKA